VKRFAFQLKFLSMLTFLLA